METLCSICPLQATTATVVTARDNANAHNLNRPTTEPPLPVHALHPGPFRLPTLQSPEQNNPSPRLCVGCPQTIPRPIPNPHSNTTTATSTRPIRSHWWGSTIAKGGGSTASRFQIEWRTFRHTQQITRRPHRPHRPHPAQRHLVKVHFRGRFGTMFVQPWFREKTSPGVGSCVQQCHNPPDLAPPPRSSFTQHFIVGVGDDQEEQQGIGPTQSQTILGQTEVRCQSRVWDGRGGRHHQSRGECHGATS